MEVYEQAFGWGDTEKVRHVIVHHQPKIADGSGGHFDIQYQVYDLDNPQEWPVRPFEESFRNLSRLSIVGARDLEVKQIENISKWTERVELRSVRLVSFLTDDLYSDLHWRKKSVRIDIKQWRLSGINGYADGVYQLMDNYVDPVTAKEEAQVLSSLDTIDDGELVELVKPLLIW